MLTFDIYQPPPTRQEIDAEKVRLAEFKKQLIRQSIISDGLHGGALLLLYYFDMLSGYGLLAVISLGTVIAVVLATTLKKLRAADLMTVAFVAVAAAFAAGGTVYGLPGDSIAGSVLAGVITGSIVMFSTLIGRWMLRVFNGLEQLKSLAEYAASEQEMLQLCREHPHLEDYRQQALEILRPNLTFGELQSMRDSLKR
jgi:prepilin signal peptidase PulO-like enzyme (type II secretory pathway)